MSISLAIVVVSAASMLTSSSPHHTLLGNSRASAASMLTSSSSPHNILTNSKIIDPRDGSSVAALDSESSSSKKKTLCFLVPQLGEFDSAELAEQLAAVDGELSSAGIDLRVIGIGDAAAAKRFSAFTGLRLDCIRTDPDAAVHRALELHCGPDWNVPESVPDSVLSFFLDTLPGGAPKDEAALRPVFDAWLNYMAMCAGIAAPGTLPEIARGYFGDRTAPERIASDATVKAGSLIEIGPGVGPVRLGPFKYSQPWADEAGYQRPLELATVRLRHMVEVLSEWDGYVSNPLHIAQRGATYLFDENGEMLYEYRHKGVLTYSATMSRPLTFLAPYIGAKALNPIGLGDDAIAKKVGDGENGGTTAAGTVAPTASSRSGAASMRMLAADGESKKPIDVSDLGLTMADLEKPLPEELFTADDGGGLATSGYESTSRVAGTKDQGCAWEETANTVEVTLVLQGLRGQPSAALAADLTSTTLTLTVFGTAVWSCVLRGEIDVDASSAVADDGADMIPVMRITVFKKAPGAGRWDGFIQSIGEDSILT